MEKEAFVNGEMLEEAIILAQRIRMREFRKRLKERFPVLSEPAADALIIKSILSEEFLSGAIDEDALSDAFDEAVETAARFGQETVREKTYVLKKIGDIEEFKSMLYHDVFCETGYVERYTRILNKRK